MHRSLILTVLGIVVVLGTFSVWQARPLYRWVQTQRALRLVGEIDRHLREGEMALAFARASDAYRLAPDEPRVLRAGARTTMAAGSSESLVFLQRIHDAGAATFEDQLNLVKAYLLTGDLDRARSHSARLLEEWPDNIDLLRTDFEIQIASGNHAEATRIGEKMLLLDPTDTTHRLRLSWLSLARGDGEDRALATAYLRSVAREKTPDGLRALRVLCHRKDLDADSQRELIDLVKAHPLADEPLSLHALSLSINLRPSSRSDILRAAMHERRAWSPNELAPFAFWLAAHGELEFFVENIPLDTCLGSTSILLNYIDVLVRLERWDDLTGILTRPNLPISESVQLAVQAYCARQESDDVAHGRAQLAAAVASLKNRGACQEAHVVARFAEELGQLDLARETYGFATDSKAEWTASRAFESLIRLAGSEADTWKVRALVTRYHYRFPHRKEVEDRVLYLNALLGMEIESTLQKALRIVADDPADSSARITAALALLRMRDLDTAAGLCRDCRSAELDAGQKAVWAAILAATGRPEAALGIAQTISRRELLEEERQLLSAVPGAPFALASPAPFAPFQPRQKRSQ